MRDRSSSGTPGPPHDVLAALGVRNFRLFWISQLLSLTGTWMQVAGQSWLILDLTHSAVALGTVTTLQFMPVLLFVLVGGVIADRAPKRSMLMLTQGIAALQALTLAVLSSAHLVQLWHVYILALVLGLTNAFNNPAQQAFVPELVGRDLVPDAVALNSVEFNAARMVGPALGGITIATLGIAGTFYLNAVSFVPAILALAVMRRAELKQPDPTKGAPLEQLREGLRYVRTTPPVLFVIIMLAFIGTFGFNWSVAVPLVARRLLQLRGVGFGVLMGSVGAGSLGAAILLIYHRRASEGQLILGGGALGAFLTLVGFSRSYALSVLLLGLAGFAGAVFAITANTRLEIIVPDRLRGRLMSVFVLLLIGSTPIGSYILGHVAERLGIDGAIMLFGVICVAVAAAPLAYRTTIATRGRRRTGR